MQRYLLASLFRSILVIAGVAVLVFLMVRVTGDPAALMMPRNATPDQIEAFREKMGFNRPLITQFRVFISSSIRGDLGNSLYYRMPALPLLLERLPATLELATVAMLMAIVVGIPLGLIGGWNPGSVGDKIGRTLGLLGQAMPNFWLALLFILLFAVELGWFPSVGRSEPKSVILPALALGLSTMGTLARLTRSTVLEIMGEDYIRTAKSKGLSPRLIQIRHVLRMASIPLVSVIGVRYGDLLSGAIYIEAIFSWPGLGRMVAEAVGGRDFPMVQAIAIFTSVVVVSLNLITDIVYALIDPRIRYGDNQHSRT